ncbi:MAG: RraA family protein [Acidobacteriota bacterium]
MSQKLNDEQAVFRTLAENLYSAAISDILDEMGYREQAVDPNCAIRPLSPSSVVVGRARTLLNDLDSRADEPYQLAIEALDKVGPGDVVVCTSRVPLVTGIFGELSGTRVRARGGNGAIVDGFTRDGRKLLDMDFPVLCRGISPIDTTGRARVVAYDVPVKLGQREVAPGQIIFGDMDGIILIPPEAEEEVIRRALERAEVESQVRAELKSGRSMDEVWKKYHVL